MDYSFSPETYAILEALSEEFRDEYDLDVKDGVLLVSRTAVEEIYTFVWTPGAFQTRVRSLEGIELTGVIITGEHQPGVFGAQIVFHPSAEAARPE